MFLNNSESMLFLVKEPSLSHAFHIIWRESNILLVMAVFSEEKCSKIVVATTEAQGSQSVVNRTSFTS